MLLMEYDYDTDIKSATKGSFQRWGRTSKNRNSKKYALLWLYCRGNFKITNLPLEKIENLAKSNKN